MKRTDIFEAMDGLSPELVEDGEIRTRSRGGRIAISRAAKVGLAAALAAVLTVTAVAVTPVAEKPLYRGTGEFDSVEEGPVDEFGFKTKLITTEAYSRKFFSEEVQELIDYGIQEHLAHVAHEDFDEEEPEVAKRPTNWDEVERTLGIDLLDSDVLDAAPPATYLIEWRDPPEDGYEIRCIYHDGAIYALWAERDVYVDGMNVGLTAKVFLGEHGTVQRQVPILEYTKHPYHDDREAVGRTITLGTGQTIYWEDYGLDEPYTSFTFRECGIEYSVDFKWDVLTGASYDMAYDDVVLKVMESLYFADED